MHAVCPRHMVPTVGYLCVIGIGVGWGGGVELKSVLAEMASSCRPEVSAQTR